MSPDSARTMLEWMETADVARRAPLTGRRSRACGSPPKTGTAQVANPQTGTYSAKDFIASMIGIFPTEDPQLIVYVVIQNPKGESYYGSTDRGARSSATWRSGSWTSWALPVRDEDDPALRPGVRPVPRQVQIGAVMPDLSGTPKKLLLPLLLRRTCPSRSGGAGSS